MAPPTRSVDNRCLVPELSPELCFDTARTSR